VADIDRVSLALEGQVALVTGAAHGIGREIADSLNRAGAATAYLDIRRPDDAERVGDGRHPALFIDCDVTDEAAIDLAVGQIESHFSSAPAIVVNSAATVIRKRVVDTSVDEWNDVLRTNLTSAFLTSRRVIPAMVEMRYGRLIHISSVVAVTGGEGLVAAYAASKAGLTGLSKSIAVEYGEHGVTSNVISPAWIDSGMFVPDLQRIQELPVRRFGQPGDVAAAALYLASPGAGFVTGQDLHVNGGLHRG
jgi:3-oxoacyl-[acyl-carrier protein] reductase